MNANETALLDPFDVSTPDEATELTALTRALELAEGFSLIFVRCNQIPQRERLMEDVRARLPKLNIQTLFFREPIVHLLYSIEERLTTPLPDAVFVSGLEFSLPVAAEAFSAPLIANLNASRNSFAQTLPCPVVLWVPEYVLTAIMQGAPDFFSIRSGVYFFAAKLAELTSLAKSLSIGEYWETASLSRVEKQDRITAIKRLLEDCELLPKKQRDYRTELRLHKQLGDLLYALGEPATAIIHYNCVFRIAKELGEQSDVAASLRRIGVIDEEQGRYRAALEQYEQALEIFEELGDQSGIAGLLHQIGMIYQARRKYGAALAQYEQALKIFEELGDQSGVANSVHQIGTIHQARRHYDESLAQYKQALAMFEEVDNQAGVASSLHNIGNLYLLRGEYEAALAHYVQSQKIEEELGNRLGIALSSAQIGQLLTYLGHYPDAFEHLFFAMKTFVELQSPDRQREVDNLKMLRTKWGVQNFDEAWRQATGEEVPEWLLQDKGIIA